MKTSAELREEIGRQFDRVQAIMDVATTENRDFTADEQAEVDRINGVGKDGEAGRKPGTIDKLKADLGRVELIEARQAELSQKRSIVPVQGGDGSSLGEIDEGFRLSKVRIPAQCRYQHRGLKAYKGPDAERAAYMAGMFVLGTIGKNESARRFCNELGIDTKDYGPLQISGALKEGDNSLGGYLVPIEMERSIIALREERGIARRECRIWPMGSDTLTVPRRATGVTSYFVGESVEITASDPTFNQVLLSAKKLGALVKLSSEVNEDAVISFGDYVTQEIAYAFADKEDKCLFIGDGSATYGGMTGLLNALAAGSIYTGITGNTAFSTLDLDDFEAMVGKLPMYALQNAKWYISRAGWSASMLRLAEAAGGNTVQNVAGGMAPMFLGFPVVWVQVMNSTLTAQTSTAGLAYFGDLNQGSAFGSRRGLSIATSTDRYFELDQLAIKGTERFDIVVHEIGDATNPGSIIGLTTPSS